MSEPGPWLGRAQWERDEDAETFPLTTAKHERHPDDEVADHVAQADRWGELVGRVGQLTDAAEDLHRNSHSSTVVPEWPSDRSRQVKVAVHEAVLALRRAVQAARGGLELAQIAAREGPK